MNIVQIAICRYLSSFVQYIIDILQVICTDMAGATRLITRFIAPLSGPPCVDSEFAALRYVSLIPFLSDRVALPGFTGIWSLHNEFLEIGAGDWEEHAMLLCALLLGHGLDAYVLLGNAVPDGRVAWVLTYTSGGQVRIWNPAAGRVYLPGERGCPLQSIGMIFNAKMIIANLQPNVKLNEMSFNFNEPRHWNILFNEPWRQLPLSLQPLQVMWTPPDVDRARMIESAIETDIIHRVEALRRLRAPTKWHSRQVKGRLRSLLEQYEAARCSNTPIDEAVITTALGRYATTNDVIGVPINMPFTDIATISDAAITVGVHENYERGVEFELAVYVVPYHSNIFSVWVYMASLVPRR